MKNKNLTRIGDFVWTDYFLLVLWSNLKKADIMDFNLSEDFRSIPFPYITFWLVIELYLKKVITEVQINQYTKRIYTLTPASLKKVKEESITKSCLTWYWFFLNMPEWIHITIKVSSLKLRNELEDRLWKWENSENMESSSDTKNINTQKIIVGNKILQKIRLENLNKRNLIVPCWELLEKNNEWEVLFTSSVNPFLVLYSFEKEWLVDVLASDNTQLKVWVNSRIIVETKDELLSQETIIKYWFTLPRNKETEWIYFNEKTWSVYNDSILLWNLTFDSKPYRFFRYLYNNQGVYKGFEDIGKAIDIVIKDVYRLSDIKSELPTDIKNLIQSWKKSYRLIPDDNP